MHTWLLMAGSGKMAQMVRHAEMSRALLLALMLSVCTCSACASEVPMSVASDSAAVLIAGLDSANDTSSSSDVLFHLANDSDDAVSFLIWNTPFERVLSADVFTILKDGQPLAYQGRKVKRSVPVDQDFMRIEARARIVVLVDLADYYNLSEAGEYQVSFTPSSMNGQAHLNEQTPVRIEEKAVTIRIVQ